MAQGWKIDAVADTITFNEAPPLGVNNVVVTEYAAGAVGGTDKFALAAWSGEYGYPSEVEFDSDRLWWANTPKDPQLIWASNIGNYNDHGRSTPGVASDAISYAINSRQVNAVMDLIPLDKIVVLSKGGEFLIKGGQDDVIAPETVSIKSQSNLGSNGLQAKVVGDTALMVQEQGNVVHDIGYRLDADGYRPVDISVWAQHLFTGRQTLRMEWAPAPWKCAWFVMDDGGIRGCTYMPQQEVIGWHRHDTGRTLDGAGGLDAYEDIACLPGTDQTETFRLVKRIVNGQVVRMIEQDAPEAVSDIRDWKYCDSCVTYDGRNTSATTLTLTGGTAWGEDDSLYATASAPIFTVGDTDIGDALTLLVKAYATDEETGAQVESWIKTEVTIASVISTTIAVVVPVGIVPVELRAVATAEWVFMRDTISVPHLEGRTVTILADGSVHPKRVVTAGKVTLQRPGGVVTVGIPYRGHIETLEINDPDAKTLLTTVGLLVQDSRGIKTCGGTLRDEYTYELPQREFEAWGEPTRPLTGYGEVPVSAEWGANLGHFHIISDDPLPMTILGVVPRFIKAGRTG